MASIHLFSVLPSCLAARAVSVPEPYSMCQSWASQDTTGAKVGLGGRSSEAAGTGGHSRGRTAESLQPTKTVSAVFLGDPGRDTGPRPESDRPLQPGVGERAPWISTLTSPSHQQHDWEKSKGQQKQEKMLNEETKQISKQSTQINPFWIF